MRGYSERVLKLPYEKALQIYERDILKEFKESQELKFWGLYSSVYPFMLQGILKPIEYSEFKKLLTGEDKEEKTQPLETINKFDGMSEEEILKFIEEIEQGDTITEKTNGENIINRW